MSTEFILLVGSFLFFISMLVGKAGHKYGVPVLLLFLMVGMIFGNGGFGLEFENVKTAQTIGSVCLAIILFSGGLDTKFSDIKPIIKHGVVLATLGVLTTSIFLGIFVWWFTHNIFTSLTLSILTSLLLASTVSSTDSASVFAILRSKGLQLKNNLRPILELESGSNDPVAYLLTIVLIEIIQSGSNPNYALVILMIVIQLFVGTFLGLFLGRMSVRIINRIKLDNASLYPVLLLVLGIFVFSSTYYLKGNGYLAVYIAGLVLGNSKFVHKRSSMRFMDGFAWMSQILLFLTLGLLVNPKELIPLLVPALFISLFLIFVARPATVFVLLSPFRNVRIKDKLFISWVGLRGAVPIIFAILPLAAGIPHARIIFNIVFIITIVSLLIQGTSLSLVAKWLNLSVQPENYKKMESFDFEFSEEIKSAFTEILITEETLKYGKNLIELPLPERTLVVLVKRKDSYFIPAATTRLMKDDKLLVVSDDEEALKNTYETIGIYDYSYQKNN